MEIKFIFAKRLKKMEKYYSKNWTNQETYDIAYKIATNEDYRHKFQKMILQLNYHHGPVLEWVTDFIKAKLFPIGEIDYNQLTKYFLDDASAYWKYASLGFPAMEVDYE